MRISGSLFGFVILLLLANGCSQDSAFIPSEYLENARMYKPGRDEQVKLRQQVEKRGEDFDEAWGLVRDYIPPTANHYHSALLDQWAHRLRSNAQYALDLLEAGEPEMRERSFCIWDRILTYQDTDPDSPTYGIWPYYAEEPLKDMKRPDWNWADFIGVIMLETYMKYSELLPDSLITGMEEALLHASLSIKKRDVKPDYTNIAIMGTLVTHLTGRLFSHRELNEYADMRLKRFYDYSMNLGGFEEYNSPTYTVVALNELMRMKQFMLEPEALEMVDYCYRLGWETLASRFHPPSGQLAGPHSRSYSTLLRQGFYDLLYGASDGSINYGNASVPADKFRLNHAIPEDLIFSFQELSQDKVVIDTFSTDQNPVIGTTYLHPLFALGTTNRSTTWQQRRPWLIYWKNGQEVCYLRVRLFHDGEDFGIGNIFSVQDENKVLTAMNFATNGGDYHLHLDRISEGRFRASDVRLRFEIVPSSLLDQVKLHQNRILLSDNILRIEINMLYSEFGNRILTRETGSDDGSCWIDWVIYRGEEQEFNLNDPERAVFAWSTLVSAESGEPVISSPEYELTGDSLLLGFEDLSLCVPVKPAPEKVLQNHTMIEY
jgi:hypothetical protein